MFPIRDHIHLSREECASARHPIVTATSARVVAGKSTPLQLLECRLDRLSFVHSVLRLRRRNERPLSHHSVMF